MSELAAMGVGVVVGGMVGASYTKTMGTVERRQEALGKRVLETNKRLRTVGDVVRYRGELERLRQKQAAAGASSRRLDDGVREVARRYRAAKRDLKSYGVEVGQAVREQRRLQRELRATQRVQRALQRRARAGAGMRAMRGMAVGATGTAYGAARLVGQAMDLEEQRLHLRTVIVAEDPEAAVGDAVAHARAFARDTLASETELLEIQYQLGSAGIEAETAHAATEVAHRVAVVTRGEGAEVAGIVGAVEKNLSGGMAGTVEERVGRIGDVLAKTQAKFKFSNFGDLGSAMAKATAGAKEMRLDLISLNTALGHLVGGELSGEEAGTAMTGMLLKLGDATSKLGTKIVRTADGGLDLPGTLDAITEATQGMDIDARSNALTKAFGIDGLKAISLLREATGEMRRDMADLGDAEGFAGEQYRRFAESASGKWKVLSGNLRQVGTAIATQLLPALNRVVAPLASVGSWLAGVAERSPVVGKMISLVAAAVVGFAGAALVGAAAMWAFNAAAALNPLVWVGALIVGAAVAIVAFWSPIKRFFAGLWGPIGGFFAGLKEATGPLREAFGAVGAAMAPLREAFGAVGDAMASLFDSVRASGVDFAAWGKAGVTAGKAIGEGIEALVAPLLVVGNLLGATWSLVTGDFETAKRRAGQAWEWTKRGLFVEDEPSDETPAKAARVGAAVKRTVATGAVVAGATVAPAAPTDAAPAPPGGATFAAAAPTQDAVPPAAQFPAITAGSPPAAPISSGRPVSVQVTANITVQPPAGADEQEIAREVARQLADAMRRAAVEARLTETDA